MKINITDSLSLQEKKTLLLITLYIYLKNNLLIKKYIILYKNKLKKPDYY